MPSSCINSAVTTFNRKLKKLIKAHHHASLLEIVTNRKLYTNHGLHLNGQGKERLANQIVSHILSVLEQSEGHNNKAVPVIPLNWKDEFTVNSLSEQKATCPISLDWNKPDGSVAEDKSLNRVITRNRKLPAT